MDREYSQKAFCGHCGAENTEREIYASSVHGGRGFTDTYECKKCKKSFCLVVEN